MTSTIDDKEVVEVDIDILKEYYEMAKNFINHVERIIEERKEDE